MQLHNIKPKNKPKKRKRVGRGGKRGTYSGKGMKGQKSRAGRRIRPEIRDLIKKIPKRRGYGQLRRRKARVSVSYSKVARKFKPGETVTPKKLLERGLIKRIGGKLPEVKLLGAGSRDERKFLVQNCRISGEKR